MKTNKAAGLDYAITAKALQGGGTVMQWQMLSIASVLKCTQIWHHLTSGSLASLSLCPRRVTWAFWPTMGEFPCFSIAAKVYNKILLIRIRDEVDPILRNNQAGFHPGKSCAQQIHILRRILEGFIDYQLPLVVTFIDFKKAFYSINRKVRFAVLRHYGIPEAVVNAISVLYKNSKKRCDGWWKLIWSIWRHYWSSAGRCSGSISICCAGWLLAEKSHVAAWLWSCKPSTPFSTTPGQNDLDFADNIALLESSIPQAQAQLSKTVEAAADLGLVISAPKTRVCDCELQPTASPSSLWRSNQSCIRF